MRSAMWLRQRGRQRQQAAGAASDGTRSDEGFVLLESIISITLITVLMAALTVLFVNAMQATVHQRASQGAIRIATDQIDQARGLSYSGALSGRDRSSVQAQFDAAPSKVLAALSSRSDQAYDPDASNGSGAVACDGATSGCAQLPTVPVQQSIATTTFTTSYYEEWCYRNAADKTTADCIPSSEKQSGVTYNQYLRVVVAVGWTESDCGAGGCLYVSSILLNGTAEPLFYFNDVPPPKPDLSACTPPDVAIGDVYSVEDPAHPAIDIVGAGGICAITGGVPQITWTGSGLPQGLSVVAAGEVIGTVSDSAVSVSGATFTATDAFLIQGTSPAFAWKVLPRLVVSSAADQIGVVGSAVGALNMTVTGGAGVPYAWTTTGLPAGVTAVPAGSGNSQLKITGTPQTAGTSRVTITVADKSTTRTVSTTFTWSVYPQLLVTVPPAQASTVNHQIDPLPLPVTGGSGDYTITLTSGSLPAGLALQGDKSSGYRIAGTPATTGAKTATFTVADATSGQSRTVAIPWTVYAQPVIADMGDQTTGTQATVNLPSISTCGNTDCTYTATGLPPGLSIDAGTGVISGVTTADTGSYTVTVTVTDHSRVSATTDPFTWRVVARPRLNPLGDQAWLVGRSVSGPAVVVGSCPNGGCVLSAAGLPSGVTLSSGTVAGAPASAGSGTATVTVTDAAGQSDIASFHWRVYALPTVSAPATTASGAGQTTSIALPNTCDHGPCTFSATGVPGGLSVDEATGAITGSATAAGASVMTVVITDGGGQHASVTFTWTVEPTLVFAVPDQYSQTGTNVNVPLSVFVSGGSGSYQSYSITSGTLPNGMVLNATTGTVSKSTSNSGKYPMTITVIDSRGVKADAVFDWTTHKSSSSKLAMSSPGPKTYPLDVPMSLDLWDFTSGGTTPYTFSTSNAPGWATLNPATGTVSGVPDELTLTPQGKSTSVSVTFTVHDAKGASKSVTVAWTVK